MGLQLRRLMEAITSGGGIAPIIPLAATRLVLVSGQSLSIGTMTQASQPPYPSQPELPSRIKTFNAIPPTGLGNVVATDANTSSLIQYQELTGTLGASGYYTHGVGFFKWLNGKDDASQQWVWAGAGVGGATITQVDSGGAYASYANEQKFLQRIKLLDASTVPTAILFSQGESNYTDTTMDAYYAKLVTYKANQLSAVTAQFPSATPYFLIDQCGDGLASIRVHHAQANAHRNGLATLVGPKYWLNRLYPNVMTTEQLHLNVNGYTYQGEMFGRALEKMVSDGSFSPCIITSIAYSNPTTIVLTCNVPNGGSLVIDTTTLPAVPGYGISLQKPTLDELIPTSVTVSGNQITCVFAETVYPDFRFKIGYTATDKTNDGTPSGNYMPMTNIRGSVANTSPSGLAAWYDWLCLDRHTVATTTTGYVKPGTLGTELYRTAAVGLTNGLASAVTFDGTNMTVTRNGVTNSPIPTAGFIDGGVSPDSLYWPIVAGKTYRVQGTCQVTSGAGTHEIRIYTGSLGIVKRSSTNSGTLGAFSVDIVAAGTSGTLELRVNNTAIVGQISNISVREVLP